MKTRSQRKYLDQLLPELVRAVLSCVRPADALPLARCAKHWREAYLSNEAVWKQWYLADFGPFPWAGAPDWLEGYRWLERYRSAWTLRIEPGVGALGLAIGTDFSAYSPRGHPDSGEMSELEEEEEFHRRGRLTVRNMGDERDSDDSSDADDRPTTRSTSSTACITTMLKTMMEVLWIPTRSTWASTCQKTKTIA